jgi:hypothetical protein
MKIKPAAATQGQPQSTKTSTSGNISGGGAPGQSMSSRNKPCKPAAGAQGQRKAGGANGHAGTGSYASRR